MTPEGGLVAIELTVNGDRVSLAVPPERTLVEVLRYDLGLTGTKQGCDEGDCGACTVLVDGRPVPSCLVLALEADGSRVDTVEGLATGPKLHPLQDAFVRHGATQCGFCTPGVLASAVALLAREPSPSREDIKTAISGNLCRCTGYTKILDAIEDAAAAIRREGAPRWASSARASRASTAPIG
jgi:aerobic-type carbon monoxide dehydrogenase small subunit (CoxS/CutS family)